MLSQVHHESGETPFELDAMAAARRYQRWLFQSVEPHLGRRLLEVGSGIGTMTSWLVRHAPTIATDIDDALLDRLKANVPSWVAPPWDVRRLDIGHDEVPPELLDDLDTVVSFNVLEHIPDDRAAVQGMIEALRKSTANGPRNLIIFVPAHQWAHGSVDRTFGHCRRYSKKSLRDLVAGELGAGADIHIRYFNTFGLPGWFLMGKVLRRPTFGPSSVGMMERLIPALRRVDPILHGRVDLPLGQSLLLVARVNR